MVRSIFLAAALGFSSLIVLTPNSKAASFATGGFPVVVQQDPGVLSSVGLAGGVATLNNFGAATVEYNNVGFRSTDRFLYGVELTLSGNPINGSNNGFVRIASDGSTTNLGSFGLPTDPVARFDAGDISADGTTMFISMGTQTNVPSANFPHAGKLFTLDLTALGNPATTVSQINISGDDGNVNDWAFNAGDGLLYGGDQRDGQLAILNPNNGQRTDVALAGLPTGVGFGAAWIEPTTGSLFLYRNNSPGTVYEVDLSGPSIVQSFTGPDTLLNDGAFISIPEPATLLITLLAGVGVLLRRRSH